MTERILIVDDDRSLCQTLEAGLQRRGFEVAWRTSADEAIAAAGTLEFDVVLTDLNMRGLNGIELCERLVANRSDVPVIVLTAFGSFEAAVGAIRAGAYDFISKPVQIETLALALRRAAQHRSLREEVKRLRDEVGRRGQIDDFVGASAPMQRVQQLILRVGDSDASVLITGESGTGKEVAAHAVPPP